jgi:hypothetical protein
MSGGRVGLSRRSWRYGGQRRSYSRDAHSFRRGRGGREQGRGERVHSRLSRLDFVQQRVVCSLVLISSRLVLSRLIGEASYLVDGVGEFREVECHLPFRTL